MYCPNCGTQTAADQKFCRGCGMSLAQMSQMLAEQSRAGDLKVYAEPANVRGEVDQRRRYMRLGFILFWGGIMLAALLGIVGDAMMSLSWRLGHFIENMAGLGGLVLLGGIGVMLYSRFAAPAKTFGPARPPAIPPPAGPVSHPGQPFPSFQGREPAAPSVTEHTTYTLDQQGPGSPPRRS